MAETLGSLGQAALPATTLTSILTVGGSATAVLSSLVVCNRGGTATTLRVSHAIAGAVDAVGQYLYYDLPIPANDTFAASLGVTLAATDVIRAYAGNGNLSINLYGVSQT